MVIRFARSSTPDTVRVSVRCGRGLPAAAPAIGCCAVTCRSRTPQTARKANALKGCDKNRRSQCCAPWHRRMTAAMTRCAKRRVREWQQAAAPAIGCCAVTCRSCYRRRAPCGRHRLTVRKAPVRRRCSLAAPASCRFTVTCRGEDPVFVGNAVHEGLNQRFLSSCLWIQSRNDRSCRSRKWMYCWWVRV